MKKNYFFVFVLSLLSITLTYAQPTATTSWTGGGGDTDWFNTSNWDNGVPDANDVAYITLSNAQVLISGSTPALAEYLFVAGQADLEIAENASLNVDGQGSGHGIHYFGAGASLVNHGDISVQNTDNIALFFQGGGGSNSATGTITIDNGKDGFGLFNDDFDNAGSVNLGPTLTSRGLRYGNAATFHNQCGGQFNVLGCGDDGIGGSISGTVFLNDGDLCIEEANVGSNAIKPGVTFTNNANYSTSGCSTTTAGGNCGGAVPTMGEWALILFGLIILSIGVVTVMRWEKANRLETA